MTTCPHCNYKYSPDPDKKNSHGMFFDVVVFIDGRDEHVEAVRDVEGGIFRTDRKFMYACPKCGKTFIEVE